MEATGKQRVYLNNLKAEGDKQYEEWMTRENGEDESPSEKYARVNYLSAVHKELQDGSRKFYFLPRSQLRDECLEAKWIKAWTGSEKFAPTDEGFAQIADEA